MSSTRAVSHSSVIKPDFRVPKLYDRAEASLLAGGDERFDGVDPIGADSLVASQQGEFLANLAKGIDNIFERWRLRQMRPADQSAGFQR